MHFTPFLWLDQLSKQDLSALALFCGGKCNKSSDEFCYQAKSSSTMTKLLPTLTMSKYWGSMFLLSGLCPAQSSLCQFNCKILWSPIFQFWIALPCPSFFCLSPIPLGWEDSFHSPPGAFSQDAGSSSFPLNSLPIKLTDRWTLDTSHALKKKPKNHCHNWRYKTTEDILMSVSMRTI